MPSSSCASGTAHADAWLRFLAVVAACFFLPGPLVRLLAPVRDGWFAMFAGSFGGGFACGLAYCVARAMMGAHLAPIALVMPVFGGIMAAWAVSTIGSLGFGVAAVWSRLRDSR